MKTAEILARVNEVASFADPVAKTALEALAADLSDAIRQEIAEAKGCGTVAAALRRVIKDAKRDNTHEALHGAWIDDDGKQLVCDGFRAFRLNDPVPLPEKPEGLEPVNITQIFKDVAKCRKRRETVSLRTPDAKEVKAFITLERANKGRKVTPMWNFGPCLPLVRADYLLDLLIVLPDAKLTTDAKSWLGPVYATGEAGEAVVLPVRSDEKAAEFRAREAERAKARREEELAAKQAAKLAAQQAAPTVSLDDFAAIVSSKHNAA